MADFVVLELDHVTVTAPAELMDETIAWYGLLLGLTRLEKPPGTRASGAWFECGGREIHISEDPHNPPKEAHFAIVVDRLDPAVEALRARGCHIEQAAVIPGRRRLFTRDPAGNRVEVIEMAG